MLEQVVTDFNEAIFDTDRDKALGVVHGALEKGMSPEEIIFQVVTPALSYFLEGVSEGQDINLAQHFMTSQIAAEVTEEMVAKFEKAPEVFGHMVIGTASGDLHSLGKRIVVGCLQSQMIEVTDLGVNVPAEKFVDEALAKNAQVIGISTMMVHTARGENGCIKVRELLKQRNLDGKIKIIVGGAPYTFDHGLYQTVQADAWAEDGIAAGKVIVELIKEVQR